MSATLTQIVKQWDRNSQTGMENAMRDSLRDMQGYHQRVVSGWRNKPVFAFMIVKGRNRLTGQFRAGKHGQLWKWVDEGTGQYGPKKRPYFIYPRNVPKLKFRTGYLPRTKPIARMNAGPGQAIGPWVATDFVLHPGIKGREFTQTYIESLFRPVFRQRIHDAIFRRR